MGSASSLLQQKKNVKRIDVKPALRRRKSVRQKFTGEFLSNKGIPGDGDDTTDTMSQLDAKLHFNGEVFRAKALFMRPILKNRPEKDKAVIKKQDNRELLKEMYRRMDPTVNKGGEVDGEVEVGIKFKPEDNLLLVKIGRAKDLKTREDSFRPNPFIVADIFTATNPNDLTTRKTPVEPSTCDPNFQHVLAFLMTQQKISHTKLRITVLDGVESWQEDFMGEVLLDLCKLDIYNATTTWFKLCPQTDISFCGTLETSMTFTKPNSLVVTIKRANNVKPCDENDLTSNPYAKVFVTTFPTTFQTNVQYHTVNPEWIASFEFDVTPSEFHKAFVVINILNKNNRGRSDQRLGDVHIPLAKFNVNQNGLSKEYVLKDLRNAVWSRSGRTDEELALEFREAMKAHMMYCYPKFIFKKHERGSRMVISCKSRKAQKRAQIIIENGNVVA